MCTFAADFEKITPDKVKKFALLPARRRDGGIGRHEGLKIPWPVMAVRVRFPLAVQKKKRLALRVAFVFFCFKLSTFRFHLSATTFFLTATNVPLPLAVRGSPLKVTLASISVVYFSVSPLRVTLSDKSCALTSIPL